MNGRILVTGGAGFIGSHTVVELANAGFEPIILDNFSNSEKNVLEGLSNILGRKVKCYDEDCCDHDTVDKIFNAENFSGVIHFAALKSVPESVQIPLDYYHNNIVSLITLLRAMKKYDVHDFVFSSSCTVYGQPDKLPVSEDSTFKEAFSPYGSTKQMCESILQDEVKAKSNLKVIPLRYFNPIGAHPSAEIGELPIGNPNNLVPFLTQSVAGLREKLTIFGNDYDTPDGTAIRDYLHVVDLAKAHVSALQFLTGSNQPSLFEPFNVGTGKGTSVMELVLAFEKATGKKVKYKIGKRRPGDAEAVYANCNKAKKGLKWQTSLSLEDALSDAWRWQEQLMKTRP